MLTGPMIQNIGPEFCVWGCDIAQGCKGYITSKDTKRGSHIQYTGPINIQSVYNILYDGDICCIVCT